MKKRINVFSIFPLFKKNKGQILTEQVIFIVLNIFFLAILILFIFRQSSGGILLEQSYAKQIALLIDSARPLSEVIIKLDMGDGMKVDKKWFAENFARVLSIDGDVVTVKLSEKGGYSYSFFNDVDVSSEIGPTGKAIIIIRNKNG